MSTITPTGDPRVAGCASCGTPLASDQRYCLSCGARRDQARLPFQDALAPATVLPPSPPGPPVIPPATIWYPPPPSSGVSTTTVLAALACVLVAFGVGLLVGNQGGDRDPVVIGGAVAPVAAGTAPPAADPAATDAAAAADDAATDDAADEAESGGSGAAESGDTVPAALPEADKAAAAEVEKTSTEVPEAKPLSDSASQNLDSDDPDKAREASQSLPDVVSTGD